MTILLIIGAMFAAVNDKAAEIYKRPIMVPAFAIGACLDLLTHYTILAITN